MCDSQKITCGSPFSLSTQLGSSGLATNTLSHLTCMHMYVCMYVHTHVRIYLAHRGQKDVSGPQELALKKAVSCYVGAGN